MSECPNPATTGNCARVAAQDLVERELILVDVTGGQALGQTGLYLDKRATAALEVFTPRGVRAEGMVDIADLGCVTCGKCVQIVDDCGEVSVQFANPQ